jgi:hypothetical protein
MAGEGTFLKPSNLRFITSKELHEWWCNDPSGASADVLEYIATDDLDHAYSLGRVAGNAGVKELGSIIALEIRSEDLKRFTNIVAFLAGFLGAGARLTESLLTPILSSLIAQTPDKYQADYGFSFIHIGIALITSGQWYKIIQPSLFATIKMRLRNIRQDISLNHHELHYLLGEFKSIDLDDHQPSEALRQ